MPCVDLSAMDRLWKKKKGLLKLTNFFKTAYLGSFHLIKPPIKVLLTSRSYDPCCEQYKGNGIFLVYQMYVSSPSSGAYTWSCFV